MRGFVQSWFVLIFVMGAVGCGSVPAAKNDAGDTDAAVDSGTEGCTPNAFVCGAGDALYQCDEEGVTLTKVQDCQYGCDVDACKECVANTTFCNGDELVQCDENGKIVNPMSCQYGCQMDRCNTCEPGIAYCDGTSAVTCGDDGLPGASMSCGAAGCAGGVCNACQPNTTTCQGDKLVVCNGSGQVSSTTDCALGCSTTGGAHCLVMTPSYGVGLPSGTLPALNVTENGSLDISNCPTSATLTIGNTMSVINGAPQLSQVAQSGGPPICVVRFGSISIDSGATFTIINSASPGHVVSLQSVGDIQVAGTITFTSNATGPSPGGTVNIVGTNSGKRYGPGGGGGGAARAGGAGGKYNTTNGGAGGAAVTTITTRLTGGSAGGNVMDGTSVVGTGGKGGGGLQIISLTKVTVTATGRIGVNGGGGIGLGSGLLTGDMPAGGGGSGGTLVVEAPAINLSAGAVAAANGGGGAGGCYTCTTIMIGDVPILRCNHHNGQPGQLSANRAMGGDCTNGGGDGGWEANGATNPSIVGETWSTNTASAGGGGGSSGFIFLRARSANQVSIANGAVVSPMPTIGAVTAN